jgi:hypothetical protein
MRLADSRRAKLSRFRILDLVSEAIIGFTCSQLAKRSGQTNWNTRSFRANLTTRLRRLHQQGLIRRDLDKVSRPAHSRRDGIYRWRITSRGVMRLRWAKQKELV